MFIQHPGHSIFKIFTPNWFKTRLSKNHPFVHLCCWHLDIDIDIGSLRMVTACLNITIDVNFLNSVFKFTGNLNHRRKDIYIWSNRFYKFLLEDLRCIELSQTINFWAFLRNKEPGIFGQVFLELQKVAFVRASLVSGVTLKKTDIICLG